LVLKLLDNEYLIPQIQASPNFLPKNHSSKALADASLLPQTMIIPQEFSVKTEEPERNTDLQSTKNKTKKKRKLNNGEESIASERINPSPKNRDTKNEGIS
jgi:hypothetical protein